MPAFVLLCRDRKDAADLRARLRPAHLDYLEAHFEEVWLAGPLLSDEGSPIGSVVIIDAEDARGARNFANADPYAKGGLFDDVEIRPYRFVKGKLLGAGPV
ncbi:MAG TPA: YciI family protein [Amphiplicatus sp.]|nr:hypothetical protein [Caulobacterales bacterium]HOP18917.1 YciI family protein [Amphiplicatus sp.]